MTAFFRQRWKFTLVFLFIVSVGLIYVRTATPGYESTTKLLIKFGQDARAGVSSQNNNSGASSADEHREIVQSNVNILASRDLGESLLNQITPARAYPKLVAAPERSAVMQYAHQIIDEWNQLIGNTPSRDTLMDKAYKHYTEDLTIKTENESDIINVGLYNQDPELAQTMLQELIDLFIARQTEIYANPESNILSKQAAEAKARLLDAQKRLYKYKAHAGTASVEEELTLMLKQRSDLAQEKGSRERTYSHYVNARGNGAADPDVSAIDSQMSSLDRKIAGTVQRKSQNDDLSREIRMDEDNYAAAQTRAQEAEAVESLNQQKISQVSIIEQPTLPYRATRPLKSVILLLCLFTGAALGVAISILAESFDRRFTLPEQAAAELGIPLFASFAYSSAKRIKR